MELTAKRGKNVFDSLFPSDEELKYLEDTFQWGQLSERLAERTAQNAIKDAASRGDRGNVGVPKDILAKFLIDVNAPQLLDLATKSSLVADILQNPTFWIEKLSHDFPEVNVVFGVYRGDNMVLDESGKLVVDTMLDNFRKEIEPKFWRNLYMVMRFWFTRIRRHTLSLEYRRFNEFVIHYDYTASGGAQAHIKYPGGIRPDKVIAEGRPFEDALRDVKKGAWPWYVRAYFIERKRTFPKEILGFNQFLANMFDLEDDTHWVDFEFVVQVLDTYYNQMTDKKITFEAAVKRGYILERDGKPMIGACVHCEEAPARVYAGCCRQVEYCSAECAQANWLEHRKVCAERK